MHTLIRRGKRDEGFVMVVVLVVILITVILGASLVSSAVWTSSHGRADYAQKQALAVANAGLQAAINRLSNQAEDNPTQEKECFTVKYVPEEAGERCPPQPEEPAKGQHYTYYVSPALSESANHCTGLWLVVPKEKEALDSLYQRCITSIGTASGATARVQARVADLVAKNPFPVNGIFSYSSLEFVNTATLTGEVGARTSVVAKKTISNSVQVHYGTTATGCEGSCTKTQLTSEQLNAAPYKLPQQEAAPYAASAASNNNASITWSAASGGSLNAGKRELVIENAGAEITIPSGTYNLCYIFMRNTATIKYTPPVKIYIDSPNRTGSGCSAGTGTVEMRNSVAWTDTAASPKSTDLEFFVWGNPSITPPSASSPLFEFTNTVTGPFYGMIYAPYSRMELINKVNMVGSIVGGWIKFTNEVKIVGEGGGSTDNTTGANFYTTAYHQCPSSYSGSPASGCY